MPKDETTVKAMLGLLVALLIGFCGLGSYAVTVAVEAKAAAAEARAETRSAVAGIDEFKARVLSSLERIELELRELRREKSPK